MPSLLKPKTEEIRVLLVEDNPADSEWVQRALFESGSGRFHLEWAESLSEGLEFLERSSVEVILLDMRLPDGNGLELFEKVHERAPHLPIVILTGDIAEERIALQAIERGAQDYLLKGKIDEGSLIRSLRYAIERKKVKSELALANAALKELIGQDPLTGVLNRRGFQEVLTKISMVRKRIQFDLQALLLDLDDFKILNERYG